MVYDCVIIGAGVCGCAIARELSRYEAKICVLEKEEDVCCGTSKANSAIIHAGFDALPGTWKAKMNVEGSRKIEELSRELDFPFRRIGALVLCTEKEKKKELETLLERGRKNKVPDLTILDGDELREKEPQISQKVVAALYAPTSGIVCPFEMTLAYAENAVQNGAEFRFRQKVTGIRPCEGSGREDPLFEIEVENQESIQTRFVVNAAGVYADQIHNMVCQKKLTITPRKGEYCLLDKSAGDMVSHTIFALPDERGKGVLVTPTVHGNLLLGPTATDLLDREGTNTTAKGLRMVAEKASKMVEHLPMREVITSFAGLRAHESGGDFVIGEAEDVPGFYDCAGIESPGLSSAPAIGSYVAQAIAGRMHLAPKKNFQKKRTGIVKIAQLPLEERNAWIQKNPAYGKIVCRCEEISEGEILDAIRRPLGASSMDGVKRRVRAGMGRCQGGFCSPRVMELLAMEKGIPLTEVTKSGGSSYLLKGQTKESAEEQEVKPL